MGKIVAVLLTGLALTFAAAIELPSDAELSIVSEGEVVGEGSIESGNLELDLLAGFSGSATLTVVDSAGNELTFEVLISGDGEITLAGESESFYLDEVVTGEVAVSLEESLDADAEASGENAFGAGVAGHVELPDVALEGQLRGEANHAEAGAKADEESGSDDEDGPESIGIGASVRGEASAGAGAGGSDGGGDGESDGGSDGDSGSDDGGSDGESEGGSGGGASAGAGAEIGAGVGLGGGGD